MAAAAAAIDADLVVLEGSIAEGSHAGQPHAGHPHAEGSGVQGRHLAQLTRRVRALQGLCRIAVSHLPVSLLRLNAKAVTVLCVPYLWP